MNVLLRSLLLLVLLVALGTSSAQALAPPHDASNQITCANCHFPGSSINSVGFTNFCNTCHVPSGRANWMPFSPVDASNIFNNVTTKRTGTLMNISHNWGGSLVVPKAGAVTPTNPQLLYAPLVGLSCERCHNIHNPRESATNSAPFLRALNDRDQMCLDCHSPRKTTNQTTGSHPVTMTYTTAIKKFANYTSRFYKTPVNANPTNRTSAMNLSKGGVLLCSTCHGVHYTDSNSATYDNNSSVYGILTPSAGYLLRTDLRGATANAVNICTNCHRGYTAHNGKGQNIQCADCHGGHVDEADGSKPNVWLIQRYMSYSTPVAGRVNNRSLLVQTIFTSTVSKNYRDGRGTGVCQSCHALPNTVAEHSQAGVNCNTCHTHANAWTPTGSSCTTCHGQPPITNTIGGPNGMPTNYTGNDATSPHGPHATLGYSCNDCHNGAAHQSGNFQQVFISTAGYMAARNGANPTYDKAARTCATTYCHSNGVITGRVSGAPAYKTVTWPGTKGTIIGTAAECASCHGAATGTLMATASHTAHISSYTFGCKECHSNTAASNTSLVAGGAHLNGTGYLNGVDVKFDAAGRNASGSYASTVGVLSCSATYCHSKGTSTATILAPYSTAKWGGTLPANCTGCHGGNATVAASRMITTGKHQAHINNASLGGKFGCVECHAATVTADTTLVAGKVNHVNGIINYSGTNAGTVAAGVCSASYCHSSGQATPVYITTAAWTSATTYTCKSCHGASSTGPAGVVTSNFGEPNYVNYTTAGSIYRNSHSRHVAAATDCQTCHATTTADGVSILTGSTTHIDRARNVAFNPANTNVAGATYNATLKTCSNVACHSGTTMKWGSVLPAGCTACHPTLSGAHAAHVGTLPSTVTFYAYTANKSAGSELTANTFYAFGCANCHPTDAALHRNGVTDVVLAQNAAGGSLKAKNLTSAAYNAAAGVCSGVYCHSNGQATPTYAATPAWVGGTLGSDKCAACHGNSPTSGAHAAHTVGLHYDDIYNGVFGKYSAAAAVGKPAGHGDPSQSTTLSCNICHNSTVSVAYNDKNIACASCHNGTRAALKGNAAVTNRALHVNGARDLSFWTGGAIRSKAQLRDSVFSDYTAGGGFWTRNGGYKTGAASYDSARSPLNSSMYSAGSCSNIACHNGRTVSWTADVGKGQDCVICHSRL